jgi:cysteinyl-tRNA synthetase
LRGARFAEPPDLEPRATDYIGAIIAMTQTLIDKGYAYAASNGDILYSVRRFPDYGRLSGKKIDDLRAGARVQVDDAKQDPLDFVLWKMAKPGEPSWPSPWGEGRPGWHIECSAMSTSLLGDYFDLHGGGMDLKFPHHENEIAQSCAACGTPFVHFWMHNGFVRINDEKMSKSLDNFFTVRDVLKTLRDPEVLRLFLIEQPLSRTDQLFRSAARASRRDAARASIGRSRTPVMASRERPRSMRSARPWMTTSTRPRRWRSCRAWRAN